MSWLVTGGAGYIGAHVVRAFAGEGIDTVVVDDLSSGPRGVRPEQELRSCSGSILDGRAARGHVRQARRAGRRAPRGLQVRGRLGAAAAAHLPAERRRARRCCWPRWRRTGVDRIVFSSSAAVYGTPDVDLVTEDDPEASRVAVRRVEAHRRVAAARPGARHRPARTRACATSTSSDRARPTCSTRARTTCSRSCSRRCSRVAPRASTATTTRRPTARACATTSTSPTSPRRTSSRRSDSTRASRIEPRLQPRQRRRRLGRRDHGRGGRRSPASTSRPRSDPAARATRPGSSLRASSRRATSTGGCGTRLAEMVAERVGGAQSCHRVDNV